MSIELLSPEKLKEFNNKLSDNYGKMGDIPFFRLVWSEDLLERRIMTHTEEGFELLFPEVRLVRKYRPWIRDKYILEGLQVIDSRVETDLVTEISYEPVWTFRDRNDNYLIPRWDAIYFILETVKANQEGTPGPKYKDPMSEEGWEESEIARLEQELFGNETPLTTALSHRSGVAYGPGSSPNSSTPNIKES